MATEGLADPGVGAMVAAPKAAQLEAVTVAVPGSRDFHFAAKGIESKITDKRMRRVWKKFQMPDSLCYRIPGKGKWAYCSRLGEICVYEAALANGLRFPIASPIREILGFLGLAVGQLMPNAWRILVGYVVLWQVSGGG